MKKVTKLYYSSLEVRTYPDEWSEDLDVEVGVLQRARRRLHEVRDDYCGRPIQALDPVHEDAAVLPDDGVHDGEGRLQSVHEILFAVETEVIDALEARLGAPDQEQENNYRLIQSPSPIDTRRSFAKCDSRDLCC